jgi:hypothetical protein
MYQPDRLIGAAAAGTGNAGDRHHQIDAGFRQRAARHGLRRWPADRAVIAQGLGRHPKHLLLGFVRISHETAVEDGGGTGDLRQSARHQSASAGFRGCDGQLAIDAKLDKSGRRGKHLGGHRALHGSRTVAVA